MKRNACNSQNHPSTLCLISVGQGDIGWTVEGGNRERGSHGPITGTLNSPSLQRSKHLCHGACGDEGGTEWKGEMDGGEASHQQQEHRILYHCKDSDDLAGVLLMVMEEGQTKEMIEVKRVHTLQTRDIPCMR